MPAATTTVASPTVEHARAVDDRGEAREADLVDGAGVHVPADAGADRGLAGRVLTGAGRKDLADEHRVDGIRGDAALLERAA